MPRNDDGLRADGTMMLLRTVTVADVMTRRVHVASAVAPFKLLARLMDENRISGIPIVDQHGIPIGIVSETDLCLDDRDFETSQAGGINASEIMTAPEVIESDATLGAAERLMEEKNVGCLVVVDGRGCIAGIVSRSDLQVLTRSKDIPRNV
ncbi:MAG: hypothetical protein PVS3B2_03600 [Candidatus Dormibacteraceae bacterium]